MVSEAQKRAAQKYDNANTIQLKIKLNKKTDADIISALSNVPNKQGYIKNLIRVELKK